MEFEYMQFKHPLSKKSFFLCLNLFVVLVLSTETQGDEEDGSKKKERRKMCGVGVVGDQER
jgi:hypothetical protein